MFLINKLLKSSLKKSKKSLSNNPKKKYMNLTNNFEHFNT